MVIKITLSNKVFYSLATIMILILMSTGLYAIDGSGIKHSMGEIEGLSDVEGGVKYDGIIYATGFFTEDKKTVFDKGVFLGEVVFSSGVNYMSEVSLPVYSDFIGNVEFKGNVNARTLRLGYNENLNKSCKEGNEGMMALKSRTSDISICIEKDDDYMEVVLPTEKQLELFINRRDELNHLIAYRGCYSSKG